MRGEIRARPRRAGAARRGRADVERRGRLRARGRPAGDAEPAVVAGPRARARRADRASGPRDRARERAGEGDEAPAQP